MVIEGRGCTSSTGSHFFKCRTTWSATTAVVSLRGTFVRARGSAVRLLRKRQISARSSALRTLRAATWLWTGFSCYMLQFALSAASMGNWLVERYGVACMSADSSWCKHLCHMQHWMFLNRTACTHM